MVSGDYLLRRIDAVLDLSCHVEGMSTRDAARVFGLHRETVSKMLRFSVPPGYRRSDPVRRPKLDAFEGGAVEALARPELRVLVSPGTQPMCGKLVSVSLATGSMSRGHQPP